MHSIEVIIKGRVQGVFFRYFTKKKADDLGVFGTVENLTNGDVKVIASSSRDILNQFVEWCHRGSPASRVDRVIVEKLNVYKVYDDFRILR